MQILQYIIYYYCLYLPVYRTINMLFSHEMACQYLDIQSAKAYLRTMRVKFEDHLSESSSESSQSMDSSSTDTVRETESESETVTEESAQSLSDDGELPEEEESADGEEDDESSCATDDKDDNTSSSIEKRLATFPPSINQCNSVMNSHRSDTLFCVAYFAPVYSDSGDGKPRVIARNYV